MPSEIEIEAAQQGFYIADEGGCELEDCWEAALRAAEAVKWLPIEKGYIDAEVYLCYFPENKGVEKYKAHGLLSVAKAKGATHYMIPTPPTQTEGI